MKVEFNRKGTLNILNFARKGLIITINEKGDKTPFTYHIKHKLTIKNDNKTRSIYKKQICSK